MRRDQPSHLPRVFITGMGAITPIGNDVESFWQNLLAGRSGAGKISLFATDGMPHDIACEVRNFEPTAYMDGDTAQQFHRSAQFAIAVSRQALQDANLTLHPGNWERVGVVIATGGGGINSFEAGAVALLQNGWHAVDPLTIANALPSTVSCLVSIETGARGPVVTHVAACASGHYPLIAGFHLLQRGEADVIIAGGVEASISMLTMVAFGRMGPLSKRTDDPEHASRPFSIDRDGFVAGEGGAAVILETEEHARQRGARLHAEVLGGKITADAHHITAPDPTGDGAARAILGALEMAHLTPQDIDVVYAHGTGTTLNDISETHALKRAFGESVHNLKITSIKSMVGHGLGAAGAEAVVAAVKTLNTGLIPPTVNFTSDPEIDLDVVANTPEQVDARHIIVNGFGFGGQNVVLVLGQV